MLTCSWSGSTAPAVKRISAVISPVLGSASKVFTSQPAKRVGFHSISAGLTTWECSPSLPFDARLASSSQALPKASVGLLVSSKNLFGNCIMANVKTPLGDHAEWRAPGPRQLDLASF